MPSFAIFDPVTSNTAGFGSSVVAYGYAMTGTTTADCAVSAIVINTFFTNNQFYAAQYQSSSFIVTATGPYTATDVPVWGR